MWINKAIKYIDKKARDSRNNLMFPIEFDGLKLSLWDNYHTIDAKNIYEEIPTWFWMSNIYYDIASYKSNRQKLTNQLYDLNHKDYCHKEGFHAKIDPTCFCKICGHQMEH